MFSTYSLFSLLHSRIEGVLALSFPSINKVQTDKLNWIFIPFVGTQETRPVSYKPTEQQKGHFHVYLCMENGRIVESIPLEPGIGSISISFHFFNEMFFFSWVGTTGFHWYWDTCANIFPFTIYCSLHLLLIYLFVLLFMLLFTLSISQFN